MTQAHTLLKIVKLLENRQITISNKSIKNEYCRMGEEIPLISNQFFSFQYEIYFPATSITAIYTCGVCECLYGANEGLDFFLG